MMKNLVPATVAAVTLAASGGAFAQATVKEDGQWRAAIGQDDGQRRQHAQGDRSLQPSALDLGPSCGGAH